ncbi:MAG: VWA domain-containing protein [Pyrinomonadaceae bacterium]
MRRILPNLFFILSVVVGVTVINGQQPRPNPTPTPPGSQDQEPIKVFTEEVRLPVVATDEFGRFDPTLSKVDILVQEDGVPQEISSVRRIPASILMLLGTGNGPNPAVRLSTTRALALRLLRDLGSNDRVALVQFGNKVEVLQDWTGNKIAFEDVLTNKLHSGNGSLLAPAIKAAAALLEKEPPGNRHLFLVTDGVDVPDGRAGYKELMAILKPDVRQTAADKAEWDAALQELMAAQATVHVVSYATYGLNVSKGKVKENQEVPYLRPPDRPAGTDRPGKGYSGPTLDPMIVFDPSRRKLRKAYESAMNTAVPRLAALADETGAKLRQPENAGEMVDQADDVAREIGAQYVVTYQPKRPLSGSAPGEYRRIQVSTRRIGLQLRTRRGYVVTRQN